MVTAGCEVTKGVDTVNMLSSGWMVTRFCKCLCILARTAIHCKMMRTPARSVCSVMDETRQMRTDYRNPMEEKGWQGSSLSEREDQSPGQAFIAFLGTLHWRWSSFTMHRFASGGYLLQKTKERMLLITSKKKDICKCKGKSGWTGYTGP